MAFVKPSEIPQASIRRRGFRGFDRTETEELLASIAESYEEVWEERDRLEAEVTALRGEMATLWNRAKQAAALEEEVARLQGKLGSVHKLDERMRNALLSAEWMSEKRKAEVRRESELTLRKAQQRAGEIVSRAEEQTDRLRAEVERLQELEHQTRETCRALLTSALRQLDGSNGASEARAFPHPLAGLREEER
jgi:cell division septum initiation protein DivIVA